AHALLHRREWLRVEHVAEALDRVAHRLRVRHDVELREVHPGGIEVELCPHGRPVGAAVDGGDGSGLIGRGSAGCCGADESQADARYKVPAVQGHSSISSAIVAAARPGYYAASAKYGSDFAASSSKIRRKAFDPVWPRSPPTRRANERVRP